MNKKILFLIGDRIVVFIVAIGVVLVWRASKSI